MRNFINWRDEFFKRQESEIHFCHLCGMEISVDQFDYSGLCDECFHERRNNLKID